MAVALSSLASRIQTSVPAVDNVPADYDQIAKDAVEHVSSTAPMVKESEISVASGVDIYDLPADFMKLIWLESLATVHDVIVSDSGLIPIPRDYYERHQIHGGQIRLYPVPSYAVTRKLRYTARYILDGSDIIQDMTDDVAILAVTYGRYLALSEQAVDASNKAWAYSIGDERIDMTKRAQAIREQAKFTLDEFTAKLKARPEASFGQRYRVNKWDFSAQV